MLVLRFSKSIAFTQPQGGEIFERRATPDEVRVAGNSTIMSDRQAYINHNGKFHPADAAVLKVDNRAYRYGWGLFETMLVRDAAIRLGTYHWDRLMNGARVLGMHLPALTTAAFFENEVLRTVRKNGLEQLARVRLQLYNGHGGLFESPDQSAGFTIECFPVEEHLTQINEAGLTIGIAQSVRKSIDSLAALKTTNALIYSVAAAEARANKWNDALIINTTANVAESTIANLFWIKGGTAYTPPVSEGCIAGVMRRHLLERLPALGISVQESAISPEGLHDVENIFLTNAIRGVRWIGHYDNQAFSCGLAPQIAVNLF